MKDERISIRVTEEEKKELNVIAEKNKMNVSQFVHKAINEKMETEKLSDSQERFLNVFDIAFKRSYDSFFKQMMVVLNRIDFNSRWSIKQQDIFMGQLQVPQNKDDLAISIIDHPITEVAHDKVLQDIRKMSSKKYNGSIDE